jgi:hypothetical protein
MTRLARSWAAAFVLSCLAGFAPLGRAGQIAWDLQGTIELLNPSAPIPGGYPDAGAAAAEKLASLGVTPGAP